MHKKFPVAGLKSIISFTRYTIFTSTPCKFTMNSKKICIIGAGAAGILAIRHIKDDPTLEGQVFEQSNSIGGVWNYTDKIGKDEFGIPIHTTMYKALRTNLPKEIMGFLDSPFPDNGYSYIGHGEVQLYLQKYFEEHELAKFIKFTTRVVSVEPELTPNSIPSCPRWKVKAENLQTKVTTEDIFDAVMVCNGHYTKPYYPGIVNLDQFKGEVVHSRDYRVPERFSGKRVVVIGGGPSAIDIAIELIGHAFQVVLSSRKPSSTMPKEVIPKSSIVSATPNSLITSIGESIECDVLLLCTGYAYDFPFLSPNSGISIEKNKYIFPLYRHFINANYTSLVFIGIPFTVLPFILFDYQIRYFIKTLNGELILPSQSNMIEEIKQEEKLRLDKNIPLHHSHKFGAMQWTYFYRLAEEAGFLHLIHPVVQKIYSRAESRRSNNPSGFRQDKIIRIDNDCFEYIDDAFV